MAVDFDALDLVRTQNRAEMHERKKIEFLEDRIKITNGVSWICISNVRYNNFCT